MTTDQTAYVDAIRKISPCPYEEIHISKVNLPEDELNKVLEWTKSPDRILFFSGTPGVGKSYLCAAIAKYLLEQKKIFRCFNEKSFFSHLRAKINENIDAEYEIDRLCQTPYFLLDDVGAAENMTDWQKEQLFSFVDNRSASGLPTVITSNLFLKDVESIFSPRLVSRIKARKNIIIELNWIDKRQL